MKYSKKQMQSLAYGYGDNGDLEKIEEKIIDHTRWSVVSQMIFKDTTTGKFYRSSFSVGATEMQDESAYEYDKDEIEVEEVVPVEKTITVWEKK